MTIGSRLKIDYYVGGAIHLLIKPIVVLFGAVMRRDHRLDQVRDIAVLKLLGGGSLLTAYPSLLALKQRAAPGAFRLITLSGTRHFAEVIGLFDEIIIVRDQSVVSIFVDAVRAIRRLWRCDALIDLEVHSRLSTIFCLLTCARNRIGFYTQESFWRRSLATHLLFFHQGSHVNFFYEQVIREGAECFHDVSKAHCQVLVGFLDVKFPNWDARESEAAWDYFFPAIAEKFPQLVNRAWRGRLKYPHGPRVAAELGHVAPGRGAFRHPGQLLSPRALVFGTMILAAGIGALYLHRHPVNWAKLTAPQSHGPAMVFAGASPTPAEPAGLPSSPAETFAATGNSAEPPADGSSPMSDPGPTTDSGMATKEPGDGMLAAAKPGPGGSMEAAPAAPMSATPEMAATPAADAPPAGSTPGLFKPPGAATPAPVTTGIPAATPRKAVLLTKAIAVQTAYGKVTIAPGTVLKIVGKDSETVKISYMNTIVTVPIASTDLEP